MIESFKKDKKGPYKSQNSKKSDEMALTPDCQAYASTHSLFSESDLIIFVLDSRNPFSCRHGHFENVYKSKYIFVLNKIDLIPQEVAIAWLKALNEVAPTFAISALNDVEPIRDYIAAKAVESNKTISVVISGVSHVGKHTIMDKLDNVKGADIKCTQDWIWLQQTPDLVSLGAFDISTVGQKSIDNARDILFRCSIHSLMELFSVPFLNDVDLIFSSIDDNRKIASIELLRSLNQGKYLYYTVPPAAYSSDITDEINQLQRNALKFSLPGDLHIEPFIHIGYGTQNKIKVSVLKKFKKIK